jgi:hypothetical protein
MRIPCGELWRSAIVARLFHRSEQPETVESCKAPLEKRGKSRSLPTDQLRWLAAGAC